MMKMDRGAPSSGLSASWKAAIQQQQSLVNACLECLRGEVRRPRGRGARSGSALSQAVSQGQSEVDDTRPNATIAVGMAILALTALG